MLRAGAVAFLHKPVTDQHLLAVIEAAIRGGPGESGAPEPRYRETYPGKIYWLQGLLKNSTSPIARRQKLSRSLFAISLQSINK